MKMLKYRVLLAGIASAYACCHSMYAQAADELSLKAEALVKGPSVHLGDVASLTGDNAETLASIELAPAPLPGESKRFEASLIQARIRNAGFEDASVQVTGSASVKATTMHIEVSKEAIAEDLRQFIELSMPWDAADATIDILPPAYDVVLPDGDITFAWKPNPQYKYVGSGAFRGEIAVDGAVKKTVMCRATVDAYTDVVVAQEMIQAGGIIAVADLTLEKRPVAKLEADALIVLDDAVGQVARGALFPGAIITKRGIMPRKLIKRNQVVSVEARTGAVVVKTQGKALSDGAVGDLVSVSSLQSKQEVQGVLRRDGVVVIE